LMGGGVRKSFTHGAVIDSPPVQHSLQNQLREPRRKWRWSPQTTRDTPKVVDKPSIIEAELICFPSHGSKTLASLSWVVLIWGRIAYFTQTISVGTGVAFVVLVNVKNALRCFPTQGRKRRLLMTSAIFLGHTLFHSRTLILSVKPRSFLVVAVDGVLLTVLSTQKWFSRWKQLHCKIFKSLCEIPCFRAT